jgi:hypothetical protein
MDQLNIALGRIGQHVGDGEHFTPAYATLLDSYGTVAVKVLKLMIWSA